MRDEIDSLWSRGNGSWLGPISTDWDRVACEDDVAINVCVVVRQPKPNKLNSVPRFQTGASDRANY